MAIRPSVTVSMAEESNGMCSSMPPDSRVRVSASLGTTSDAAGSSRTSSKVSPSRANFSGRPARALGTSIASSPITRGRVSITVGRAGSADDDVTEPLSPAEREDVLADLEDLEVFRTLLEPRSVRGLVVDCEDCQEPHYFGWDLLHSNLRHLLDLGQMRVHEPAFDPDPAQYVSWDYARGFADGVLDTAENAED